MNRPWVVRLVAALLVVVGLQAGAFRDLPTNDERYYGTDDHGAAVRPEARKPDVLPHPAPALLPPRAVRTARFDVPALALPGGTAAPRFHPEPTGPPRS